MRVRTHASVASSPATIGASARRTTGSRHRQRPQLPLIVGQYHRVSERLICVYIEIDDHICSRPSAFSPSLLSYDMLSRTPRDSVGNDAPLSLSFSLVYLLVLLRLSFFSILSRLPLVVMLANDTRLPGLWHVCFVFFYWNRNLATCSIARQSRGRPDRSREPASRLA